MKDQIIYTVNGNTFFIDKNTGDLLLNGESIPHSVALELIEVLRHDLYQVKEQRENFFTRLFK